MLQPHAEMQPEPTRLGRVLRRMLSGGPLLGLVAALAVLPSGAHGAIAEHEILQLPGWDHALPSRQYSGFVSAEETSTPGHERYLHYVFVEAENSPETAPVVLWTNGGSSKVRYQGVDLSFCVVASTTLRRTHLLHHPCCPLSYNQKV